MSGIHLTETDRTILASYSNVLEGLATYLGEGFEFVLHSLENYEESAIKVVNGFHTGRSEGCPITEMALQMLDKINQEQNEGYQTYFSKNRKGDPLKSTTIAIYGENGNTIGLLCINFYLKTPMVDFVQTMFQNPHSTFQDEVFLQQGDNYIEDTVNHAVHTVDKLSHVAPSMRNKEIIALLKKQGVFQLKDAVIRVAALLDISKNTVYLHLRTLEAQETQH